MRAPSRPAILLCLCVCLLSVSVAPVAAADVDHEHPDEIEGDSNIEQVQQWLEGRMGVAHIDCAEGISTGSDRLCGALESGNYSSLLDRYETIEGEVDGGETAALFNETRREQLELAALRVQFDETRSDYELARAAGNEQEARARARELQRLAERIEDLGGEVERNFAELDETTSVDFTAAAADINETTTEVQAVQRTVENETFTRTQLTATTATQLTATTNATATTDTQLTATTNATATFGAPAVISGRLVTENGTTRSNARVVIDDGTETFETRTNETGFYRLLYRPVRTERGETALTIAYQPAAETPYLGSETRVNVTVGGTNASVRLRSVPGRVSFRTNTSVEGVVRAAGRPVPNAPVTVTIAGQQPTATRTGDEGSFSTSLGVAPTVATGSETLRVRAGESETAIRPTRRTANVIVEETETTLGGEATLADAELRVTGQLRPAVETDREIGPRPLVIAFGSETRTARTDADGSFSLATTANASTETVTISYTEAGTNLAPVTREVAVSEETPAPTREASVWNTIGTALRETSMRAIAIGGTVVVVLLAGGSLARRWWRSSTSTDSSPPVSIDGITDDTTASMTGEATDATEQLLTTARERLESDPDGAVRMSYAAVRAALPTDETQTHREFSQAYRRTLDDRAADSLDRLTDAFEVAAFAPTPIDDAQATAAVDAATRVLETVSGG